MGNCAATHQFLGSVELTVDKRYCKAYRYGAKKRDRPMKHCRPYDNVQLPTALNLSTTDHNDEQLAINEHQQQQQVPLASTADNSNAQVQNISFCLDENQSLTLQLPVEFVGRSPLIDALLLDATDQSVTSSARRMRLATKQLLSADDREYYYSTTDDPPTNVQSPNYFRLNETGLLSIDPITPNVDDEMTSTPLTHRQCQPVHDESNVRGAAITNRRGARPCRGGAGGGGGRIRTAPRLAVSRYAPVNTSTGSSTSGVDVSMSSSRSELMQLMRQVPGVAAAAAVSVDADCEDNVEDDVDDTVAIYRSASFRRAIERGNTPCIEDIGPESWHLAQQQQQSFLLATANNNGQQTAAVAAADNSCSKASASTCRQHVTSGTTDDDSKNMAHEAPLDLSTTSGLQQQLLLQQNRSSEKRVLMTSDSGATDMQMDDDSFTDSTAFDDTVTGLAVDSATLSPGSRRRCLSTLTEEELSDAMHSSSVGTSGNLQVISTTTAGHGRAANSSSAVANAEVKATDAENKTNASCKWTKTEQSDVSCNDVSMTSVTQFISSTSNTATTKACTELSNDCISKMGKIKRKSMQEMRMLQNTSTCMNDDDGTDELESVSSRYQTTDKSETIRITTTSDVISSLFDSEEPSDVFPSLTAELLSQLRPDCVHLLNSCPEEALLQETEDKFATLSLAFKTDGQTLEKRLELHARAREVAETNIQKELDGIRQGLQALTLQVSSNQQGREVIATTQHHVDVLEQAIRRLSSQAELHGAVHQEMRISEVVDIMILHVENLKRTYQKEHAELEEARKSMLSGKTSSGGNDGMSNRANGSSLNASKVNRRRASIAVISKVPILPARTGMSSSDDLTFRSLDCSNKPALESLLSLPRSTSLSENESSHSKTPSRLLLRQCSSSALADRIASSSSLLASPCPSTTPDSGLDGETDDIEAEYEAFRRRQNQLGLIKPAETETVDQRLPITSPVNTDSADESKAVDDLTGSQSEDGINELSSGISPAMRIALAAAAAATGIAAIGPGAVEVATPSRSISTGTKTSAGGSTSGYESRSVGRGSRYRNGSTMSGTVLHSLSSVIEQNSDEDEDTSSSWSQPPARRRSVRLSISSRSPSLSRQSPARKLKSGLKFSSLANYWPPSAWLTPEIQRKLNGVSTLVCDQGQRLAAATVHCLSTRHGRLALSGLVVIVAVYYVVRYIWSCVLAAAAFFASIIGF